MSDSASLRRIATRGSALALWQAHHVAGLLADVAPEITVEIEIISTEGDRRTDVPLAQIGGKGVFVKEVQAAVLDGRADIAVHSAKDLPALTPTGLVIVAVPERADARDVLVGGRLADLPAGATVATGSPRRRAQLADLRPDLRFEELRGNIDTRLAKSSSFDAIVMAKAALDRLDRHPEVVDPIDVDVMVPQVGQAALAIECRADDHDLVELLSRLDHRATRLAVDAERAFLARLGGDCDLPAGAHATVADDDTITLTGVLLDAGDTTMRRFASVGQVPDELGALVAERLLSGTGT